MEGWQWALGAVNLEHGSQIAKRVQWEGETDTHPVPPVPGWKTPRTPYLLRGSAPSSLADKSNTMGPRNMLWWSRDDTLIFILYTAIFAGDLLLEELLNCLSNQGFGQKFLKK